MTTTANEIETYGAMLVGFWSMEFLQGWSGLMVTIGSGLLVWAKLVFLLIDRFKKKNKKNEQ